MVIERNIILHKKARVFEKVWNGPLIGKTRKFVTRGDVIGIGKREKITFDHRDQFAYPFEGKDSEKIYYLLEYEIQDSLSALN